MIKVYVSEFHYQVNITGRNNMDGVITLVLQGTKGRSANIPLMTYVKY